MGNSFRYLFAKKFDHRMWIDRVIEKIKRFSFLPHRVLMLLIYLVTIYRKCSFTSKYFYLCVRSIG